SRVHRVFPPLRASTVKTCKITELMSIPDQIWTVRFTWSPGAAKLPTAPGGSLRKDGPGWAKAENKFTATSGVPACVCVCVCVLCRLHICMCVFQCVVCAIKNLTKVLIIINYYLLVCVCVCVCVCACASTGTPHCSTCLCPSVT